MILNCKYTDVHNSIITLLSFITFITLYVIVLTLSVDHILILYILLVMPISGE